jgi:hypothetical protein
MLANINLSRKATKETKVLMLVKLTNIFYGLITPLFAQFYSHGRMTVRHEKMRETVVILKNHYNKNPGNCKIFCEDSENQSCRNRGDFRDLLITPAQAGVWQKFKVSGLVSSHHIRNPK